MLKPWDLSSDPNQPCENSWEGDILGREDPHTGGSQRFTERP